MRVSTEQDAVAQLTGDAIVIAGGTVLTPEITRELRDGLFVDISGIASLRDLKVSDEGARIGALVTNEDIAGDRRLATNYAALCLAARSIGNPHVRRAGTIGGNLAWALPRACLPPALLVLNAEAILLNAAGRSVVPVSDLLRTGLPPRTLLVAVQLPAPAGQRSAYVKYAWRRATAMALVTLSISLRFDDGGNVIEPRIAVGGLCRARRLTRAEAALAGRIVNAGLVNNIASIAAAEPPFEEEGTPPGETFRRRLVADGIRLMLSQQLEG